MESNFMYSVFVYIGCRVRDFYHKIKRELIFADLFDELAEQFPQGKVDQLKDFIKSMGFFYLGFCSYTGNKIHNISSNVYFYIADSKIDVDVRLETARDCFGILRDQAIFTKEDVIFIQYLLKRTKCEELYNRCLEYAENNYALCFYEKEPGKYI